MKSIYTTLNKWHELNQVNCTLGQFLNMTETVWGTTETCNNKYFDK